MQGILFTLDNHKAIRDKVKIQTRRLDHLKEINKEPSSWNFCGNAVRIIPPVKVGDSLFQQADGHCISARPRYQTGETVYLKEAWWEDSGDIYFKSDFREGQIPTNMCFTEPLGKSKWHSPLFLKEILARTFIKITDVRPERLQDISREDSLAEGVSFQDYKQDYQWAFAKLWDSINKTYPFDGNYWVWRICFNLIEDKR